MSVAPDRGEAQVASRERRIAHELVDIADERNPSLIEHDDVVHEAVRDAQVLLDEKERGKRRLVTLANKVAGSKVAVYRRGWPELFPFAADFWYTFPGYLPGGRGATVCMFPMFHMASWSIGLGCWQAREEVMMATPEPEREFIAAKAAQDYRIANVYAGQSVGAVDAVEDAAAIVRRIADGAVARLNAVGELSGTAKPRGS